MEPDSPETPPPAHHRPESPRWWLPLGLFLSVLVHVILAVGITSFSWLSPPASSDNSGSVSARLVRVAATTPKTSANTAKLPPPPVKPPATERPRAIPSPKQRQIANSAPGTEPTEPSPAPEPLPQPTTVPAPDASTAPELPQPEEDSSRLAAMPNASPSPPASEVTAPEVGRAVSDDAPSTFRIDTGGTQEQSSSTTAANPSPTPGTPGEPGMTRGLPFLSDKGISLGETPVHIVYLIDVSGSMDENGKMGRVRTAMTQALSELRPGDMFNIVYFSDQVTLFSKSMCPVSEETLQTANRSLNATAPQRATNLSGAFTMALQQPGITHICLITDGEPTEGITDFEDLANFVRNHNTGNAHLIALALSEGKPLKAEPLLRRLADENQGSFRYVPVSERNGG